MKKGIKWLIIALLLVAVAVVVIIVFIPSSSKEYIFRTYEVENYSVENVVTATGTIEPVESVDVGTQVSGKIETIYVDFNSNVKKGELLAELDKQSLLQRVSQAKSTLTSAESQLKYAKQNYERNKQLFEANAATPASFEESTNAYVQAQTNMSNAQSSYDQAKVDLGYAEIYSPIDGVVLERAVEEGQTVAASYSTPTLFTIANDLTKMQVEADVDEADIGQVQVGQKVTFTVDAYSDDVFVGEVNQIRLKPTTTNNVVTYVVIISAPNPDLKLFPGMTASVTIVTEQQQGLAVPAEAFNFQPTEQLLNTLMKRNKAPKTPPTEGMNGRQPMQHDEAAMATVVWLKNGDTLMPRPVKTGMSDGAYQIIVSGLNAGDTIVLSAQMAEKKSNKDKQGSNPFMPQPPKR